MRCVFSHAVADQIIAPHQNPAAKVAKPRRLPSTRRALTGDQVDEITRVAATT